MGTDFARVARLLASPARSAVVDVLMEGRPLAAGELARVAGVGASTISEHLGELVGGGLLAVVSSGRHRYYRLASADVAEALEALSQICPATPVRSLRQHVADRSLRAARLCYDHLAGALGVALLDRMREADWLTEIADGDFAVTAAGTTGFGSIGIDVDGCRRAHRNFARSCLDWSERQQHLAGAVGAATAAALFERQWLRRAASGRGVAVTEQGERGLLSVFYIDMSCLTSG
jgi:DNA-binding transcriptional ArsR family regulator